MSYIYRNHDQQRIMNFKHDQYKQHTLATEVGISGAGIHTGIGVDVKLRPAETGYGYRFKRVDLPGQPVIAADCDLVTNTFRCTTLSANGASVSTVEHVLAALVATGIDNCLIELNGPELPIIDGSCMPFITLIEKAGVVVQHAEKIWYTVDSEISQYFPEKNVTMAAIPNEEFSVVTYMDFKGTVLGEQHAHLERIADFKNEIAPCRTYCFVHELEMLMEKNLLKGDLVKNAILVIDKPVSEEEMMRLQKKFSMLDFARKDGGYLNNLQLRFENEIARHKLMDVIGDLSLIGFPIKAKILGSRPGHSTNVEFAKKIKQHFLKKKGIKPAAIRA